MYGILATKEEIKMADTSSPNPGSEPEKPAAESSDSSAAELQKTIADAFDIFDHESNKTVDVRYGKVSAEGSSANSASCARKILSSCS